MISFFQQTISYLIEKYMIKLRIRMKFSVRTDVRAYAQKCALCRILLRHSSDVYCVRPFVLYIPYVLCSGLEQGVQKIK